MFLNRFFIPLFSGVCLSLFFYFSFFSNYDIDGSDVLNNRAILQISQTATAELENMVETLDILSASDRTIFPYFEATVKRTGVAIQRNIEILALECPENIGERLRHFALKIRSDSAELIAETEYEKNKIEANISEIKRDVATLQNLIILGTNKVVEEDAANRLSFNTRVVRLKRTSDIFIFSLSVILYMTVLILMLKLKRIGKILGLKKGTSLTSIYDRFEEIKKDLVGEKDEIQKNLFREQVVNRRKSALLDTIPAGIISIGSNNEVTYMNGKMKKWFGFNEDIVGENIEQILEKLEIEDFEEGKLVVDGDVFWVSLQEELNERFIVLRNITEQEDLARRLLDSERLVSIGEMASRITHEIRNPLSTIKLNSEYLVENISELDAAQVTFSMQLVVREVKRLESITEKYMNLVKYKDSKEVDKETSLPLDLVQFVSFHASEFGKRGIDFSILEVPECDLAVTVSSFKEIMLNLLKNAWEELESSGKVAVSVEIENKTALIKVEDSGKGVPEEEKESIFKNFYTKKPGGTGIGLSHSRKLAREAGGRLYVTDSFLGGACFVLEVPLRL